MLEKLFPFDSQVIEPYEEDFYHHPGTIPGTLNEDRDAPPTRVSLIDYNQNKVIPKRITYPENCARYLDTESVSWVDVQGLGNTDMLQRIGKVFELHPLVLEDVVNVPERPKIEEYDDQLVIISRMVMPTQQADGFHSEQVSFVLGKNYLLTVQEEPTLDCFDPVRLRIRNNKGIIRKQGADYLAYALLDAIIDGFFPVLEDYGERIEDLEEEVIVNPTRKTLHKIYRIRRELLQLRRAIWPQRSAINALIRDSNELISEEVRIYLRDCYDHAVQVMDMVETYRELASGLMDVYLSAVSNRMNEIMKLLTVFSWIFLPLTFIAGLYGMNFEHMPGLKAEWGFPLCVATMIAIAVGLLVFFRQSGWLESPATLKDVRGERKF
ncbi:magnesium Mg(2+) and cobalt Co(2+) transport protein CorA [Rivularia sp. PCC 7116]|uniref:magnesium/cobalt transporter CorA n=1 Tax=Rivularia sp. PCC 7116 TaxID=373994 RepID=UPI00029F1E73|nr:magnesium/cobalt transporter CorA [Rivularia sp. PCC 7116]AFY55597.1 magnesium Mg(2+) and cobalt Co(2+) transport protein CorA [Rivularia sp. PCC 7116]